jgi:hypothetical protein
MAEYKVSEDVAQAQLDAMEAEYGDIDPTSAEVVFRAIRSGLVDFDEATGQTTYHLQRPPETESSFDVTQVTLSEPDGNQMENLAKGLEIRAGKDGTATADPSYMVKQAINVVVYLGGWPTKLARQIKRRDLLNMEALSSFFA